MQLKHAWSCRLSAPIQKGLPRHSAIWISLCLYVLGFALTVARCRPVKDTFTCLVTTKSICELHYWCHLLWSNIITKNWNASRCSYFSMKAIYSVTHSCPQLPSSSPYNSSASTTLSPSVVGYRIDNDTDPCLCLEPCGLLLQFAHRVTSFSHRQASACPQCSSPRHNQQQQVWQRVIADTASWPSLAGRYWTDSVPSGCNCIPVSARHGSSVPGWTVPAHHCRQQVVVVDFGPPQPATWSCHAAVCQPTAPVPLVSLVQSAGTLYQTIWSHLTFLLIVLGSS